MKALLFVSLFLSHLALASEPLIEGYEKINKALAADKFQETKTLAQREVETAKEWLAEKPESDPLHPHVTQILTGAIKLSQAKDEKEFRFAYGTLNQGVIPYLKGTNVTKDWQLYYCPMAKGYRYWAQPLKESMANPYMGLKMLKCGSKKDWAVITGK